MHMHTTSSAAGLLMSLQSELPARDPLAREARRCADRLSHGSTTRGLEDRAAALLARLLDATDAGIASPDPDLLDLSFDD